MANQPKTWDVRDGVAARRQAGLQPTVQRVDSADVEPGASEREDAPPIRAERVDLGPDYCTCGRPSFAKGAPKGEVLVTKGSPSGAVTRDLAHACPCKGGGRG